MISTSDRVVAFLAATTRAAGRPPRGAGDGVAWAWPSAAAITVVAVGLVPFLLVVARVALALSAPLLRHSSAEIVQRLPAIVG